MTTATQHPESMRDRVQGVINLIRPAVQADGEPKYESPDMALADQSPQAPYIESELAAFKPRKRGRHSQG